MTPFANSASINEVIFGWSSRYSSIAASVAMADAVRGSLSIYSFVNILRATSLDDY